MLTKWIAAILLAGLLLAAVGTFTSLPTAPVHAEIPPDTADILPYIRLADQNMYADKIKGK